MSEEKTKTTTLKTLIEEWQATDPAHRGLAMKHLLNCASTYKREGKLALECNSEDLHACGVRQFEAVNALETAVGILGALGRVDWRVDPAEKTS